MSLVQLFDTMFFEKVRFYKVQYEIRFFVKVECLVKTVKKYFLEKLSIWLALIKVIV